MATETAAANGMPRVSVVIPCYNAERYICATIASVYAQDEQDLEVIVVDDGSSDNSVKLVRATYPAVRIVQQANQGVAAARNNGLAIARGEWIAFVDADDIWLPGKLAAQFAQLATTPACRMVYTAWQVWPSDARAPAPALLAELAASAADTARWDGASGWIYPELMLDCVVWTSTVLARRSLFDEIGNFDSTLRLGEDYDLWLRASRVTPILRVARPYALYRMHPASITRSAPTDNHRAKVLARALAQWGVDSPDGRKADMRQIRRTLAKSWSDFAGAHLEAGNPAAARRAARRAVGAHAGHAPGWKVLLKAWGRSFTGFTLAAPSNNKSNRNTP